MRARARPPPPARGPRLPAPGSPYEDRSAPENLRFAVHHRGHGCHGCATRSRSRVGTLDPRDAELRRILFVTALVMPADARIVESGPLDSATDCRSHLRWTRAPGPRTRNQRTRPLPRDEACPWRATPAVPTVLRAGRAFMRRGRSVHLAMAAFSPNSGTSAIEHRGSFPEIRIAGFKKGPPGWASPGGSPSKQ